MIGQSSCLSYHSSRCSISIRQHLLAECSQYSNLSPCHGGMYLYSNFTQEETPVLTVHQSSPPPSIVISPARSLPADEPPPYKPDTSPPSYGTVAADPVRAHHGRNGDSLAYELNSVLFLICALGSVGTFCYIAWMYTIGCQMVYMSESAEACWGWPPNDHGGW